MYILLNSNFTCSNNKANYMVELVGSLNGFEAAPGRAFTFKARMENAKYSSSSVCFFYMLSADIEIRISTGGANMLQGIGHI